MADVSLYEAPVILEGHGRPNVFLAGQVGQKYKDLDSGLEYVCTGERGFIKVDGDDQSEMYNWELVESGGSTGGGSPFIVTLDVDASSGSMTVSDKGKDVMDEIDSNYKAGNPVNAVINYTATIGSNPVTATLWLVAVQAYNYYFMTAGGTYILVYPSEGSDRWRVEERQIVHS